MKTLIGIAWGLLLLPLPALAQSGFYVVPKATVCRTGPSSNAGVTRQVGAGERLKIIVDVKQWIEVH